MDTLKTVLGNELFEISGTKVTVSTLAVVVLIVVATYVISFLIRKSILKWFGKEDPSAQGTLRAMTHLLHYLVLLIGFGIALDTLGVNLMALMATGALFAVGIGFALQNIVQNFVSGIIMLLERSIKPNDVLEVDGRIIRVMNMRIRTTIARTLDEEDIIIPNSSLVQNSVKNFTMVDSFYRLRTTVGVVYGSDMKQVFTVLKAAAYAVDWRSSLREPVVLLNEFGDSSVNFEVSVWIDNPWRLRFYRSELNNAVWWALKDAGITIAFPQVDVHLDPPVADGLVALAGGRGRG